MTFYTHRWVRGEQFWGRQQLLEQLKKRLNKFTWILGNRRIGKTSLLRQIEYLCKKEALGYTPLYLDFQGAGDEEGLKMAFLEALDEQEDCADALGLDLDALETKSLSNFLFHIKRSLKRSQLQILFLIDEAEELVDISHGNPQVLSILRKFFHGDSKISVFLTSSYVLHEVKEPSRTSQFIQEFLPPIPLFPFSQEETIEFLVSKALTKEDAEEIFRISLGNPYMVQNLGEKTLEMGLDKAFEELLHSKFFNYFFDSNFNCLPQFLREGLKDENPANFFEQLQPTRDTLQYLIQSSLFQSKGEGAEPNPLLAQVFGASRAAKPRRKEEKFERFFSFLDALSQRTTPLSALQSAETIPDSNEVLNAAEPPSRELLEMSDEKALHHTLAWASPEYCRGEEADEKSMVYLAGLALATLLLGSNPLVSVMTWKQRMAKVKSGIIKLDRSMMTEHGIPPKVGMILMKALSPHAELRYASLQVLREDLHQSLRTPVA